MSNFIILGPIGKSTATQNAVFGDVYDGVVPNAHYINNPGPVFARKLRLMLLSNTARKFIPPFIRLSQEVSYKQMKPLLAKDTDNYIIFTPSTHPLERISPMLLRKLRKHHPDCKLILYFIDGIERTAAVSKISIERLLAFFKNFDMVCTYDRIDAEKYDVPFIEIPVWISAEKPAAVSAYDLYFCGRDKGRSELLMPVYDLATAAGVNCRYHVTGLMEKNFRKDVRPAGWISYKETIDEVLKSNCVLEVLADSNFGATLRYKEAVIYNKKLLTNNPDITRLPYYDARWMRYFEKAEDIDLDWVKRVEDVDYGYKGDFSAERFLETVVELSRSKES